MLQATVASGTHPGTATAYTPAGQIEDADTSATTVGDVTGTRYYTFGGATVAVRTHDGNLALVLGDEQGSVSVTMPVTLNPDGTMASATVADAQAVTRTSYTPYGQLRSDGDEEDDNLALDRGWLGQVEDRADAATGTGTGLTYLNARYYDPVLVRFITPDPLMNPADPATLDQYRYADNNPVVFGDPSGLDPKVWNDGRVVGVPGKGSVTPVPTPSTPKKPQGTPKSPSGGGTGSGASAPVTTPSCGTNSSCNPGADGLESWGRGFLDSMTSMADGLAVGNCLHTMSGGGRVFAPTAYNTCQPDKRNDDGLRYFNTLGPKNKNSEWSYNIGLIVNPLLLVGAEGQVPTAANLVARLKSLVLLKGPVVDARVAGMVASVDSATLNYTRTVLQNTCTRPYIGSQTVVDEIMAGSTPRIDPGGVSTALRWDAPGSFNGTAGTYELVIDTDTNTVLHFLFKAG